MIFILHYTLFGAGSSAVIILLTLFLKTYSEASLTEIGALLMALPFMSILVKPLFCALADRQQAHKQYLMGSLALTALGYGSLAVAPFFPAFIREHGRLVWYLDVIGVVVGFGAFGVVWSLGDALAVNAARIKGIPWGSYRVWSTISWGVFGWLIGQINENPLMPKYVPGLLVLVGSLLLELLIVAVWPSEQLRMGADESLALPASPDGPSDGGQAAQGAGSAKEEGWELGEQAAWRSGCSLGGTLAGSARANPRLIGAVANMFMEDLGSSLKSSLKLGQPKRRLGLSEILEQHQLSERPAPAALHEQTATSTPQPQPQPLPPPLPANRCSPGGNEGGSRVGSLGRAALERTRLALSGMNSLSSVSGQAIADELLLAQWEESSPKSSLQQQQQQQQPALAGSLVGGASLRGAAASALAKADSGAREQTAAPGARTAEELQLLLLKLILQRDPGVLKYLLVFALFGFLLFVHVTYFFLHVELLCREKGYDFSQLTGLMLAAQSVSEVFTFIVVVRYYVPRVGRLGAMLTCALLYALRYAYYGTYYAHASPYSALATELCHGLVYGITYTLITDIASECVDQLDDCLPELVARGIVHPQLSASQLKLPLRATMQGVFSGAFDGLGQGIGALFAGVYLDSYSYASLWLLCAYLSLAIALVYPLSELRVCGRSKQNSQRVKQSAQ